MAESDTTKRQVESPKNVTVTLKGKTVHMKGPKGSIERTFIHPRVDISLESGTLVVYAKGSGRSEMGLVGTWEAHIKNMIKGVTSGYDYKMKIIFSHFPIKTTVKGSDLIIENFLGERYPRKAHVIEGVNVKISGDSISLSGIDKEKVGQTAANIEKATVVKNYDPRVFQDGIYLIERGE
jgi:large subunit ribosomal protein L6